MPELEIEITHDAGLHMRPASVFVKTAASFDSDIQVRNVTKDKQFVNAKSSIGVMQLGVSQGHVIAIKAEGDDADEALAKLEELIENDFKME